MTKTAKKPSEQKKLKKTFFGKVVTTMATDFKDTILRELETLRLADLYRKQSFPARAYQAAIETIKGISGPITKPEDTRGLEGIGSKIQLKIQEIISTGSLRAAAEAKRDLPIEAFQALLGVHGVGPVKAKELIEVGITSIEGLRKASEENSKFLTAAQKLGLKYYDDALLRIPREEMVEHENTILPGLSEEFEGTIVGSYRRGAASSGDIDVLLTLPDSMSKKDQGALFLRMIDLFKEVNYIVDTLSSGPTKFLGYCQVEEKPVRRLDLLMIPKAEYACAILYFTGSQQFNVAFRSYALSKGYTLNEHRLEATREGIPVVPVFNTEKDIFDFLGLQYVEPTMRRDARDVKPL
jgi:DNA polymerase/3'-5' exonuclease PolX